MRVLVCPTAFKGSLTAARVADAMREGVARGLPGAETTLLPLSDGGPGLLDALRASEDGRLETVPGVSGPLSAPARGPDAGAPGGAGSERSGVGDEGARAGATVPGRLLLLEDGRTAVVESADACGLALLEPSARDPLRTHTRGVGDLVRAAMDRAPAALIVGLGGSATCDGGVGAARQSGYRFLDDRGGELPDGGGALADLAEIRPPAPDGREGNTAPPVPELLALADVDNPLLGPEGAAATYAPQKGADRRAVERLESGLRQLVEVAARDLEADPARVRAAAERPGAGAAGGLAFGLEVFFGARVTGGTAWVLRRVGFDRALERSDLVVTGEGAYDRTTDRGKVVGEVVRRARDSGVPVRLVCGRIEGRLPDGVLGEDGGGRTLDAEGVAAVTARAVGGASEGGSGEDESGRHGAGGRPPRG